MRFFGLFTKNIHAFALQNLQARRTHVAIGNQADWPNEMAIIISQLKATTLILRNATKNLYH